MTVVGAGMRGALVLGAALGVGGAAVAQEALSEALAGTHVHGLALDGERLLIATHHGLQEFDPATGEVALLGRSRQDFMGFSVDAEGRLLASGHPEEGGNSGVLLSSDGGQSWTKLSDGVDGPVDFHQMTVSPADPATLYGAFAGGLQRSRDGGATWERVGPAPEGLIDLAASAQDPLRLYAATEAGLLVSGDGGASWEATALSGAPVSFVEVGPDAQLHAFVLGRGLLRAEEAAPEDWTVVSGPVGGDYILHFATDGRRAYAATGSGALLASEDGGATWSLAGG